MLLLTVLVSRIALFHLHAIKDTRVTRRHSAMPCAAIDCDYRARVERTLLVTRHVQCHTKWCAAPPEWGAI
jgi:hypothetical protein